MLQTMLDKASTVALPTEEVIVLPLGDVKKSSLTAGRAAGMQAITE